MEPRRHKENERREEVEETEQKGRDHEILLGERSQVV